MIYLKFLIISTLLLGMGFTARAQALTVNGSVKNIDNETTTAYYVLSNSYETLQVGKCSRFKLKLGFNDCYILTLSKRGYRSQTITISTFSKNTRKCRVAFNINLVPLMAIDLKEPDLAVGKIYYDQGLRSYNYKTCYEEQIKRQSPSHVKMHYISR